MEQRKLSCSSTRSVNNNKRLETRKKRKGRRDSTEGRSVLVVSYHDQLPAGVREPAIICPAPRPCARMREPRPAPLVSQGTRASQTASGTLGETSTPDPRWWTSGTSVSDVFRPAIGCWNWSAELQGQAFVSLIAAAKLGAGDVWRS